ncbi:hypothetical protein M427DRAFT_55645 [Gonapodya prolifera JEL478]|uniref:Reelin domain-containing protein n=1 Tax=Gonapodya prolifera (strain JEL478) TaxID=1344416 RepID=A0A139AHE3_GONPJ|nr:hypothetical protein M427DRAFT_55645 [Gonapodya prolifera JEL478]|eukprot:KXS16217.1 hypothetical protein M427DRAFT_55645 [Gonapodya prolifera JEL478]
MWARDGSGTHVGSWTAPSGFSIKTDCSEGPGLQHSNANTKTVTQFAWSSSGVNTGATVVFEAVVLTSMNSWLTLPSDSFVVGSSAAPNATPTSANPTPTSSPQSVDNDDDGSSDFMNSIAMVWIRQNRVLLVAGALGLLYLSVMTTLGRSLKKPDKRRKLRTELPRTPTVYSLGPCQRDFNQSAPSVRLLSVCDTTELSKAPPHVLRQLTYSDSSTILLGDGPFMEEDTFECYGPRDQ